MAVRACRKCGDGFEGKTNSVICEKCRTFACAACGRVCRSIRGIGHEYRFCGHGCAAAASVGTTPKGGKVDRRCGVCGRTFRVYRSRAHYRFCGKRCAQIGAGPALSRALVAMHKRRGPPRPIVWREYGRADGRTIATRSLWEAAFARRLDDLGVPWEYEPTRFVLSDGSSYNPDFWADTPFGPCYVEVHRVEKPKPGDERKIAKLAVAARELPLPLIVIGETPMREIAGAARRAD